MCRVDYADDEYQLLEAPHEVTARKEHKCSNCERPIVAHEKYWKGVWVCDMGLQTCKYCAHCKAAAEWLQAICHGYLWGDWQIIEELTEHWDEEPQFRCRSFALLIAAMRRQWEGSNVRDVERLTRAATAHAQREIQAAMDRRKAPVDA
jgi:hypothetical protein